MALQNHMKFYHIRVLVSFGGLRDLQSAYLGDTTGILLDQHAEAPESRILLLVVLDLPQRQAPSQQG